MLVSFFLFKIYKRVKLGPFCFHLLWEVRGHFPFGFSSSLFSNGYCWQDEQRQYKAVLHYLVGTDAWLDGWMDDGTWELPENEILSVCLRQTQRLWQGDSNICTRSIHIPNVIGHFTKSRCVESSCPGLFDKPWIQDPITNQPGCHGELKVTGYPNKGLILHHMDYSDLRGFLTQQPE